jgi:hypothetical protein
MRLHDTFINLKRSENLKLRDNALRAQRVAALYRPRDQAEWRIYNHFGPDDENAADQRRIKLAWYAWAAGPFGWLAKYAVYDDPVPPPVRGIDTPSCLRFRDLRFDGARDPDRGTYVLCPSATGGARVFMPYAIWPFTRGYRELVPIKGVR